MERALTMQALAQPATAVQRAQRTPVATPSSTDPPAGGSRPISGFKPVMDSVSISSEARQLEANDAPRGDRLQGPRSGATADRGMQILGELKESFFTKQGDEGFNARLDFNSDGVINAGDLGILREKMSGYAPVAGSPAQPEPEAEPEEVATLESIRNAFYTQEGDEGFNAASDLNGDGMVNAQDLGLFRQSQGDVAQPVQPVITPLTSGDDATAVAATAQPTIQISDPAPASVEPVTTGISGLAVDPDTVGVATSANAGSAAAVDVASVRESLLDQLRNAFFSRKGDDRFDAMLDSNSDGMINVADFLSVRDSV